MLSTIFAANDLALSRAILGVIAVEEALNRGKGQGVATSFIIPLLRLVLTCNVVEFDQVLYLILQEVQAMETR